MEMTLASGVEALVDPVILVVDDTPINLIATAFTLRNLGYVVDEAKNGRAVLDKLKVRSYALILMDIKMPEMSGIECCERIRALELESNFRIPIVAFSSQLEGDIKKECLDAGMDAFLAKDCTSEELAKTVEQFLLNGPPVCDQHGKVR